MINVDIAESLFAQTRKPRLSLLQPRHTPDPSPFCKVSMALLNISSDVFVYDALALWNITNDQHKRKQPLDLKMSLKLVMRATFVEKTSSWVINQIIGSGSPNVKLNQTSWRCQNVLAFRKSFYKGCFEDFSALAATCKYSVSGYSATGLITRSISKYMNEKKLRHFSTAQCLIILRQHFLILISASKC